MGVRGFSSEKFLRSQIPVGEFRAYLVRLNGFHFRDCVSGNVKFACLVVAVYIIKNGIAYASQSQKYNMHAVGLSQATINIIIDSVYCFVFEE
jgi:hypothetical protein